MQTYDTVIIGGGASGLLAGIYLDDCNSILLEQNEKLGKKMLITGGGRCNLTNNSPFKDYMKNYYNKGNYYRPAFNVFFNKDIIKLLEDNGCPTKIEEDNRVFPSSDKSESVVNCLTTLLKKSDTTYKLNAKVKSIIKKDDIFLIEYNNTLIKSKNVILSTGGLTYPQTGSDSSGYHMAIDLGHGKMDFMGGLSPISIKETWIRKLQAITLNVKIEIKANKKSIVKSEGSIIFTHNGLSGFPILDNSMNIQRHLNKNENVIINLDLADEYSYEELDNKLQKDFVEYANQGLKRYLHQYIPRNMTSIFLEHLDINPDTKLNQVTKKDRLKIRDNLKRLELTVDKVLEKEAMVTNSGIMQKEIDPNTCQSKIVDNLYITGELIEGCGICGGYNLQKAFSTGVLAAMSIKGDEII